MVDSRRFKIHPGASDPAAILCVRSGHDTEAVGCFNSKYCSDLFDGQLVRAQPPSTHKGGEQQRLNGECELRFGGIWSDGERRQQCERPKQRLARGARRQWKARADAHLQVAPPPAGSWCLRPSGCTAATKTAQDAAPVVTVAEATRNL